MIEEPIEKVTREEMVIIIIIAIKPGKAAGSSKVCVQKSYLPEEKWGLV